MNPLLEVDNLGIRIGQRQIISSLSFSVSPGQRLGIIGASGCGKTLTALAIAGLLPFNAQTSGSIRFEGEELLSKPEGELAKFRGRKISMVFQEPATALNPVQKLSRQMTAALAYHYRLSSRQRMGEALKLAKQVGLENPERILRSYPHQVSGGQRQRAQIAAAISAAPQLLLADEPTTALDVSVQAGILQLFSQLTQGQRMALIFISHDLAAVAQVAEQIIVLDEGQLVESGSLEQILAHPVHPITQALVKGAQV